jgi:hypothetical protein
MAIPRFQASGVRVETGAQGLFSQAQTSQTLADSISQFKNIAVDLGYKEATQRTKEKALKDVSEGKMDTESVAITLRDTYRQTAQTAFASKLKINSAEFANDLQFSQEETGDYNTEQFTQAWAGYEKGVLSEITDPTLRAIAKQDLQITGMTASKQIKTKEIKQNRDEQSTNITNGIQIESENLNQFYGVDNALAQNAMNNINTMVDNAVKGNLMTVNEGIAKKRIVMKNAYSTNIKREFSTAINDGQAYKYYDKFKKSDQSQVLNIDEKQKLMERMLIDIKTNNTVAKQEQDQFEAEEKVIYDDTINELNTKWINNDLTETELKDLLINDKIKNTDYMDYVKKINDTGAIADNSGELLKFETHLLEFSEEDILESPFFTNKTKQSLVNKRLEVIGDKENWLNTQTGRVARERIRTSFNILDGTMMAKLDFNNQNMRDYDDLYRSFYSEVQSLPLEQRELKALTIADKLLTTYQKKIQDEKLKKIEKRETEKKAKEEKAIQDKKDSVSGKFWNLFESNKTKTLLEDYE